MLQPKRDRHWPRPWLLVPCLGAVIAVTSVQAQVAAQPMGDLSPGIMAQLSAPTPGAPQVPASPAVPQQLQPSSPANIGDAIPPAPLSSRISIATDQLPYEVGKGPKLGPYYLIRSEDDFSYLRDRSKSNDLFDPLKFIRLDPSGRSYVTFSGEERLRYEYYTKNSFTFVDPKHQDIFYFRHLYGVDVHLGENFRAFASLNSGQVGGHNYGTPSPANRDDLALQQAFAEVMGRIGNAQVGLRAGRQEVFFGSGLLFALREPTNIHQALDGFRGYLDLPSLRIDAFAYDNVINRYGVLNDSTNAHQKFWGLYGSKALPVSNVLGVPARFYLDPTYIGYSNRTSAFVGFRGEEERHTLGGRLWGQIGSADIDLTGVYQTGHVGNADVSAYAVFSNAGYTFNSVPMKPRVGVRFDMATGGRSGNTIHTYNPLLALLGYFTENSLIAPINLYDTGIGVSFSPTNRLRVQAYTLLYWRYAQNDGIYNPGYVPFRNTATVRGTPLGMQPALRAAYVLNQHTLFSGALAFFRVDSALRNAGAKNNLYGLTQLQFKF